MHVDEDAVAYLMMANYMIHLLHPECITIAEVILRLLVNNYCLGLYYYFEVFLIPIQIFSQTLFWGIKWHGFFRPISTGLQLPSWDEQRRPSFEVILILAGQQTPEGANGGLQFFAVEDYNFPFDLQLSLGLCFVTHAFRIKTTLLHHRDIGRGVVNLP